MNIILNNCFPFIIIIIIIIIISFTLILSLLNRSGTEAYTLRSVISQPRDST
jgi:hypothetical protein